MDKKLKILIIIFGLLIVSAVALTYWRIMIKKDYIVEAQTDCDPYTQNCFIWKCDPNSSVEGEACAGDAEKDIWYYNIVKRNASRIPLCDLEDENCQALVCGENELECEQIFCDETTKTEGVECNNPTEYTEENPVEEDSDAVCDPESAEGCATDVTGDGSATENSDVETPAPEVENK